MTKLLTREDLHERGIRYSNVHLLRLEAAGQFPRRVPLGGGRNVAWLAGEIDAYVTAAIARRDAAYAHTDSAA
ncbi:MAG: AlpA family phage regulatory protein [Alphaproteobacteria bacterium]|nr:AlpA family phage regulatory protein [Alphaproteobacteria bacterium]